MLRRTLSCTSVAIGGLCLLASVAHANVPHRDAFSGIDDETLSHGFVYQLGGSTAPSTPAGDYVQRDFDSLKGMPGFSDNALDTHFKLYGGYVKNTNLLLKTLRELSDTVETGTPHYAELKRRFGWEFGGMRLHELYFENLGGNGQLPVSGDLYQRLVRDFGSYSAWEKDFRATGALRGIGWVVLYEDVATHRLVNVWVGEHNIGHLAGGQPLLVMDVWEHAYMVDYNINRGEYIDAFIKNIDWEAVATRVHP